MNFIKKTILWAALSGLLLVVFIALVNAIIIYSTNKKIYKSATDIPHNKVGLVLGTSKKMSSGNHNYYYVHRINAAAQLYKAGKVDYLLVSGDNRIKGYNEPEDMRADLVAKGVPSNRIYLDYAGFRTLDSVIRCKEIFGQNSFTVVSQKFHNQRAIFLGEANGMEVVGFSARDIRRKSRSHLKTSLREYLAKCKAVLDVVLHKKPKFMGEKIKIGSDPIVRSKEY